MHDKWQCVLRGWKPHQYGVVMMKCGTVKYNMFVNYVSVYNVKSKARNGTDISNHPREFLE